MLPQLLQGDPRVHDREDPEAVAEGVGEVAGMRCAGVIRQGGRGLEPALEARRSRGWGELQRPISEARHAVPDQVAQMLITTDDERPRLSSQTHCARPPLRWPAIAVRVLTGEPVDIGLHAGPRRSREEDLGLPGVHTGPFREEGFLARAEQVRIGCSRQPRAGLELAILDDREGRAAIGEGGVAHRDALRDRGGVEAIRVVP